MQKFIAKGLGKIYSRFYHGAKMQQKVFTQLEIIWQVNLLVEVAPSKSGLITHSYYVISHTVSEKKGLVGSCCAEINGLN